MADPGRRTGGPSGGPDGERVRAYAALVLGLALLGILLATWNYLHP